MLLSLPKQNKSYTTSNTSCYTLDWASGSLVNLLAVRSGVQFPMGWLFCDFAVEIEKS